MPHESHIVPIVRTRYVNCPSVNRASVTPGRGRPPGPGARLARRIGVVRLAVLAAALAWAPAAAAQRCTGIVATSMVFTSYSPFGPGVSATSTLTYTCQPGVTQAWIGISQPRTLTSGASSMLFDVYQAPDLLTVWTDTPPVPVPVAATSSVTVYGFLPAQDAAAGSYSTALTVALYSGPKQKRTGTATMTVTAVFPPICTIGAGTVAFGNYDPIVANATTPLDAQGSFQIACTRNAAYTVGLGLGSWAAGATRQMASGAQRLQYGLYSDAGRTTAWSDVATLSGTATSISPVTLTVYGRVFAGQVVAAGGYGDSVQSTINF